MAMSRKGKVGAVLVVALAVLGAWLGIAFSGSDGKPPPSRQHDHSAASPFTGERKTGDRTLVVKVDNAPAARPHTGLNDADIVFVEQVEGGTSRLAAVYASKFPSEVGPVRSARESDIDLLQQFGSPGLAYSGAQSKLYPLLAKASFVDLRAGVVPRAYTRGKGTAPHNLYVNPTTALAGHQVSAPRDVGYRFGETPTGGVRDADVSARFPSAAFRFQWNGGGYSVLMDGSREPTVSPKTVVIQKIKVHESRFHDFTGANSPFSETVGSGKATVLRDGRTFEVTWKRPSADDGTVYTQTNGKRMEFAPGQVWVVLDG